MPVKRDQTAGDGIQDSPDIFKGTVGIGRQCGRNLPLQYIDYERLGPGFQGREKDLLFIAEYDCFVTVLKNHILEKFILFT